MIPRNAFLLVAEAKRTDPRDESVVIDCNVYNRRKQLQPTSLLKLVSTFLPSALCLLLQIARSCCFYTLELLRFVLFLSLFLLLFIFIIFIVNCHFTIDKSITQSSIYAMYVDKKIGKFCGNCKISLREKVVELDVLKTLVEAFLKRAIKGSLLSL